ncbi:SGNH/GDSL hydrolase family protein, partial [Lactococcus cremoris]|nr:SGNH/GDSL hydrolase family protein [Lactococcus cremoris]
MIPILIVALIGLLGYEKNRSPALSGKGTSLNAAICAMTRSRLSPRDASTVVTGYPTSTGITGSR